jgi:hypothetical protein
MVLDLVLGAVAVAIGVSLQAFRTPLALLMREGDDHWREQHPWTAVYEPQTALLASDEGRLRIFRTWLVVCAGGFAAVGAGLVLRGLV